MVFDPLSIIGYVGTAAGLLSFLVSTIDNINIRVRNFKDCQDTLNWYRSKMETCHLSFRNWQAIWCNDFGGVFPDNIYEYFWGADGFVAIKRRLENIRDENERVENNLYCWPEDTDDRSWSGQVPPEYRAKPSDRECETWQHALRAASRSTNRIHGAAPSPGVLFRFCFAIARSATFKERITRLSEMIDDLHKFSRERFWELQDSGNSSQFVSSSELQRLRNLKQGVDQVSNFLTELDRVVRSSETLWALILGNPKLEQGLQCFENPEDVDFTFGFIMERKVLSGCWATSTVTIDFPNADYKNNTLSDWRDSKLRTLDVSNPIPLYPTHRLVTLKQSLEEIQRGGNRARKALELIRAKTALDLANSMVLLYGTPWTYNLCTCGVRHTPLNSNQEICVFAANGLRVRRHECCDASLGYRGFLLLAVALAELAIATPIKLLINRRSEPYFCLPDSNPQSIQQLLILVARGSSIKYKNAIRFCFELDSRLAGRDFRPEHLKQCLESIVKP